MENSYIKKYKEYISFLRANRDDLLNNDNWGMLFQVLTRLELSDEYTLDDYRSKKSTNNILRLYARKVSTERSAEEEFKKYDNIHGMDALFRNLSRKFFKKLINETEELEEESDDLPEEPVNLPEKIEPESVVTLDFTPDAIWEAYLLRTTDYYIGHRWHGGYHKMTIPANIDELKKFRPWKEYEIPEYEKFIQETEFDFAPKIIINGDVATIEHIAVFFHNRFSQCRATVHYNREARKIESFKFDSTDIFKFSEHFCY